MAERLLAYAFGALHTALILLLVVALLLSLGGASALAGIGTAAGIAIGIWLATLSWTATWWTLRGRDLATTKRRDVLGRAGIAGFAAGAAFIPGLALGFMIGAREFAIEALIFPIFAAPLRAWSDPSSASGSRGSMWGSTPSRNAASARKQGAVRAERRETVVVPGPGPGPGPRHGFQRATSYDLHRRQLPILPTALRWTNV